MSAATVARPRLSLAGLGRAGLRALARLPLERETALVALLLAIVLLMIVPLPTWLVDFLLGVNFALTILLLVVGVSLRDPLELSTLPAILLISVIFRLALSITTTRLILAQGDAGEIVRAFGDFVIFGNVVVGLVVFSIVTVVQFVVITKGAERVAEVAARFSLDGLPGKQMAIDSDLRAGLITAEDARARRANLEKHMQFHGAMDGAMKFVKGDAIAGLVIVVVNLIGGVAIGVLQRGLPLGEALDLYATLTVGDGLVAQIPALMLSITAGAIVTRVAAERAIGRAEAAQGLGGDIGAQVFGRPRLLGVAGVATLGLALAPGLPAPIFLGLGLALIGAALLGARKARRVETAALDADAEPAALEAARLAPPPMVSLELAPDLWAGLDRARLRDGLDRFRRDFFDDTGVWTPQARLRPDTGLAAGRFRLRLDGVTRAEAALALGARYLEAGAAARLAAVGLTPEAPSEPLRAGAFVYVALAPETAARLEADADAARIAGVDAAPLAPEDVPAAALASAAGPRAALFLGVEEARRLLAGLEPHAGELVRQALALCPIERIARVLQALVEDGVSIRNQRAILNAIVEWAPQETDPTLLAEYVRSNLRAQISAQHANGFGVIAAWLIAPDRLETLRAAIHDSAHGAYLALDPRTTRRLVEAARALSAERDGDGPRAALLVPIDLRRLLQKLLRANEIDAPVLSYQDIAPDAKLHAMGTLEF